jgi:hypothetical protein
MLVRVNNLRMPVEAPEAELPAAAARVLGWPVSDLGPWRILRKSLDARSRDDLRFVYSVVMELPGEGGARTHHADVQPYASESF